MLGPYFQRLPLSPPHCPRWVSWPLMDQRRRRKALSCSGFSIFQLFSSSSFPSTLPMERCSSFVGCLFPSLPCTTSLPPLSSPGICLSPGHAHRDLGREPQPAAVVSLFSRLSTASRCCLQKLCSHTHTQGPPRQNLRRDCRVPQGAQRLPAGFYLSLKSGCDRLTKALWQQLLQKSASWFNTLTLCTKPWRGQLSLVMSPHEINSFQREEVTWEHGFSASWRRHKALLKAEK